MPVRETEELITLVSTMIQSSSSTSFSREEITRLLNGMFAYGTIEDVCTNSPRDFFEKALSSSAHDVALFPFHPVELRDVLEENKICHAAPLVLFSPQAASRLVRSHKCFLAVNLKDLEGFSNAGGLFLFDCCQLDISERIAGIHIHRRGAEDQVRAIVQSIDSSIPVHNELSPPGLERKAQVEKKKFIINLPALRIREEIVAENDFEAVKRALSLRWDRHPDSKTARKPARYDAEYWLYSGFWDDIVKTASDESIVKTAQQQGSQLQLTPDEQQVFQTIMAIDQQFVLGQQYRVAGGWVRDRLLGTESEDIDIALDKMTGQEFRNYAEQYAAMNPNSGIGKSYVVDQNPDASKHLETTAIQIGPFKIDFVNLRTEDYASDSRIPGMQMTDDPSIDAQRRDLTINALFYNIGSGQIEDYVGGLEDLQTLTLRTPLDSTQTFMDDPLRMLRVLRFHSRYEGSQIAPETLQGMSDPSVHEAYRTKVSPERAGPEILKLFSGATPEESLKVLYQTGMDAALLNLPDFEGFHPPTMDQRNPHHQLNWLDHTLKVVKNMNDLMYQNRVDGKDRSLALMAAWFHDFGKLHPDIGKPKEDQPDHYTYLGHEDVSADISESFFKSIGIPEKDRKVINKIVGLHMYPHANIEEQWTKSRMGKFRDLAKIPGNERDDLWKFIFWHGKADDAAKSTESVLNDSSHYDDRMRDMNDYMSAPPPTKPLIDGRRLMEIFPTLKPQSGFIREVNERLLDEQNAGNIQTPQDAEMFVNSIRGDIESKYGDQTMASSWYKKVKADASSASLPAGYGPHGMSGEAESIRNDDQKQMIYYDSGQNSKFREGDRVRRRQGSMAFPQLDGKIVRKKGSDILVRWDDGSESSFDINDVETQMFIQRI